MFVKVAQDILNRQLDVLNQIDGELYARKYWQIGDASMGGHTRHMIELLDTLVNQYPTGVVRYDSRVRDLAIETEIEVAKNKLKELIKKVDLPNKPLKLQQRFGADVEVESNYYRELMYNIEHFIHHQATARVILFLEKIKVAPEYGMAYSTMEHLEQCAQ